MIKYTFNKICEILNAECIQCKRDDFIEFILFDSRKLINPGVSVFFALISKSGNGHQFIPELYERGLRNFVISDEINISKYHDAKFLKVQNTLIAFQQLAAFHRKQFHSIPVIGITGSNGKTIVKEWLGQALQDRFNIVKSPKSYNSQIGVPLSVWQMNDEHSLAIFEAGISKFGEMEVLEKIIQPTIAVFTNIGEAHSEGFDNIYQKAKEKTKLFKNAETLIYCLDQDEVNNAIQELVQTEKKSFKKINWSYKNSIADLFIEKVEKKQNVSIINAVYKQKNISIQIPFLDDASIENSITCWVVMLTLGMENSFIQEKMLVLQPLNMRLELKKGINQSLLINDSYSADISSLEIALNFLAQQKADGYKTVILSDFLQSGLPKEDLYHQISATLKHHKVNRIIAIGEVISEFLPLYLSEENIVQHYFPSTDNFIKHYLFSELKENTILIKGARKFKFEKIVSLLEEKVHQTVLEINLNALTHNLNEYKNKLKPSVKIMAMVKAFAYGSGGAEIAGKLQFNKVDYLGVAYTDEAVELRKSGITLPIMVMNPEENSFQSIIDFRLEPNLFSLNILEKFAVFVKQQSLSSYPVHLEMETAMNRLGFDKNEINNLLSTLNSNPVLSIQSVFTHLAGSESEELDEFSEGQFQVFKTICQNIENGLGYVFTKHIANSAGIIRHPEMQMDMVRIGIGLYGINTTNEKLDLQVVAKLRSTIAQIKTIKTGESVGYNRKSIVSRDSVIATIRIGYADGFPRNLGNGIGKIWVNGYLAPVIGSVCMDMTMIDVTDIPDVKEGEDVIIIGNEITVQQLANWAQTIPYEIMTGISQRVQRVYYEE